MSMILAYVLSLTLGISQQKKAPVQKIVEPDYTIALGASSEFHRTVLDTERLLWAKQFADALKRSQLLPQSVVTLRADFKNVTSENRIAFANAIGFSVDRWNIALTGAATIKQIKSGAADITVSFEPVLGKLAETGERAGASWFYGTTPQEPSVEAVIGLKRGADLKPTQDKEVHNEISYTIGAYFGLGTAKVAGTAMGRIEGAMNGLTNISLYETARAKQNLRLSKNLRLAALNKKAVRPQEPSLFIEKRQFEFKSTFQGDDVIEEMTIANKGNAPLRMTAYGDCSCISGESPQELKPGATARLRAKYQTTELQGEVIHSIILDTNDAENPTLKLPARIIVRPRASVIFPISDTIDATDELRPMQFFIHCEEAKRFRITDCMVNGIDLAIKQEPFSGVVKDFRKNSVETNVRGYKLTIDTTKLSSIPVYGRMMASVYVRTDSEKMPYFRIPIYVQRGIIANPDSIYLGRPVGSLDFTMTVMRPGKPFKVLKISSLSKHISASVIQNLSDYEYVIRVLYDGKAEEHQVKTELIIETDDAKQPTIRIPVESSIP
jgi:Protein of unknown function (DUF1573)